jgi:arylsulfatase A-like enzyme
MTRSEFLSFLVYGVATGSFLPLAGKAQKPARRFPNIVFVLADDMGYGDPRCYNRESKIPTPNMDRLAAEGVRFTDAHSPSAVCTPTRYGVLTGRYCWRTRLKKEVFWSGYDEPLIEPTRLTVASLLKSHGYAAGCIGKWHLGMNFAQKGGPGFVRGKTSHMSGGGGVRDVDFSKPIQGGPTDLGFDYYFGLAAGINLEPFCFIENNRTVGLPSGWREKDTPTSPGDSARGSHEGWMTEGWKDQEVGPAQASKGVAFIERCHKKNPAQPFFLYFATQSPHQPCTPPPFIRGKSAAGARGDMVAEFDWTVGEIMKALERLNLAGNTLLIATSDNGGVRADDDGNDHGHKSCGNLRGFKASLYEGGHRVPFIARWPGKIPPGTTSDQIICLTDLMATCAAIAGTELHDSAGEDSFNILPVLLQPRAEKPVREAIVHHDYSGNFAMRRGVWKLIQVAKPELYNLQDDPAEKNNLYAENADIANRLAELLEKYQREGHSRPLGRPLAR